MLRNPAVPWVAPFAVLILQLALGDFLGLGVWDFPFRLAILAAVLWMCRSAIDLRAPHWPASVLLGVAVFLVWVGPDFLIPGYRQHWLFSNSLVGRVQSTLPPAYRSEPLVLLFRFLRAAVIVPIAEELFWRGWLMRWLVNNDFQKVPLGKYVPFSFWCTAILFASEHGSYWEVGLLAGIAYNAWMVRTRSLGDCILAHAVTNAVLSVYVIAAGKWEYWS